MPRRGGVLRAAQNLDREGPKVRVAGKGVVWLRKAHSLGIPGPEQAAGEARGHSRSRGGGEDGISEPHLEGGGSRCDHPSQPAGETQRFEHGSHAGSHDCAPAGELAVASEEARFATPGVKIGLFCSTPMVAVSRAIGRKRAMEMLLTGEMIDARAALEWGLVNRVVPASELDEAVGQLAQAIVRSSPLTVGIGKEAFYAQIDLDEHRAYELTKSVMSLNSLAEDAQEGICAFMEKRPAKWRGR